jgi:pimeloyl-ACP methyl ester carboxylesterase
MARTDLSTTVVPFQAGDGFACNLLHIKGPNSPTKGPVVLVHGAGVRANLFRPPTDVTLPEMLIDEGYDVWLENWRASIDLSPNHWTLDQAAVFDHPYAIRKIVEQTGSDEVKAVIHCQGSTSFMMSAVAGLVPQVKTIVSNAVALHPIVPAVTSVKITTAVPLLKRLTDYLNPQWTVNAPTPVAKTVAAMIALLHHECNNPVCKGVSFVYGTGFPALWSHANLNDATHAWISQEFAQVPIAFFEQIVKCIHAGHLVGVENRPELPKDFVAQAPRTDARFAFFAGLNNLCFTPESQHQTFEYFDKQRPGYHSYRPIANYGHLDIFIGKNAAHDVFPIILEELAKPA